MIEKLISVLAPHYCLACRSEGMLLCPACAAVVCDENDTVCIICKTPLHSNGLCVSCRKSSYIDGGWVAGSYDGALKKLVYAYKFERAKDGYRPLAELLDLSIPQLFTTPIVANIPTAAVRMRQRGYDQTKLIAQEFARRRSLPYEELLIRDKSHRQLGADRVTRLRQAKGMFKAKDGIPSEATVLLIDDVITTGATVASAAKVLKDVGVKEVFVGVCALDRLR